MFIKYASEQLDLKKIFKNTDTNPESFSTRDITEGRLVIGECKGAGILTMGYLKGIEYKDGVVYGIIENAELGNALFCIKNAHRVNFSLSDENIGLPLTVSIGKFYAPAIGYVVGCNGSDVSFLDRNSDDAIYTRSVKSVCALEPYKEDK